MSFVALCRVLVALAGPPAAAPPSVALREAILAFESFDDARAAAGFRALLRRSPPGEIASRAHLYLGLIAFNAFKPDEAKAEFRHAMEANPAQELPPQASPKARLAFAEVRRDWTAELAAAELPPQGAGAEAAPAAATTAAVTPAPPHSHAAAYALGAVTLALAGLAIYGGIEVLSYNSTASAANEAGPTTKPTYSADAHGPASFWAVAWPVAAGLGAAGVVGTVLTW